MAAGTGTLWHAIYKINAGEWGFNMKFHMAEIDEATARSRGIEIGQRFRKVMPTESEIFFAAISKDNSKKDSRFLRAATGDGQHLVSPATTSTWDNARSSLSVRFEDDQGGEVTRKFAPIPDSVVTGGQLASPMDDILPPAMGPVPAAGAGVDWYAEYKNLLLYLCLNTHRVVAGHPPGGAYEYFPWVGAYPLKISVKRGARVSR